MKIYTLLAILAIAGFFSIAYLLNHKKDTVADSVNVKIFENIHDTIIVHDTVKIFVSNEKIITKTKIDTVKINNIVSVDTFVCKEFKTKSSDGYANVSACSKYLKEYDPTFFMTIDYFCKPCTLKIKEKFIVIDSTNRKTDYKNIIISSVIGCATGLAAGLIIKK